MFYFIYLFILIQKEAQVVPTHGSPKKSSTAIDAPKIGMKFDYDDSAYEFTKIMPTKLALVYGNNL